VTQRRGMAVAIALLLGAAVATAGCGVGPGEEVGEVSLTVTRDYGAEEVLPGAAEKASESDTVMRVLDRKAEIETRFGGGFVSSIEGLDEAAEDGRRYDWFFYVNGVESPVGAADFNLDGGEAIWWDYHDWSAASRAPAVVGSWPRPLAGGYEGEVHPVALECRGVPDACATVRSRLNEAGVAPAQGSPDDAIRVLVGPWARLRDDPAAAQLEEGPQMSGVFVDVAATAAGYRLRGLDERGEPVRNFGLDAGLVAATRRYEAPPVWIISGATPAGTLAAAQLLSAAQLRGHYAVAIEDGEETSLPLR
jgi:Domain of unknown function (DUF4430)